MTDSPNKTLDYINFNCKKAKAKYSDIDDEIFKVLLLIVSKYFLFGRNAIDRQYSY